MGINTKKWIVGGLAAGVTILVIDFAVNAFLLAGLWEREMSALDPSLAAAGQSAAAIATFSAVDVVFGLLVVWLYAAIRPRYGPGPATAVRAALFAWVYGALIWMGLTTLGLFSWALWGAGALLGLVMLVAGALVGGAIYTEEAAVAVPPGGGVAGGSLRQPERGARV